MEWLSASLCVSVSVESRENVKDDTRSFLWSGSRRREPSGIKNLMRGRTQCSRASSDEVTLGEGQTRWEMGCGGVG